MIRYVEGDATAPAASPAPKIIAHICNNRGGWGRGFVVAVSRRWPLAEARYRAWFRGQIEGAPPAELGRVQFVPVDDDLWIGNMIAQDGYTVSPDRPAIDYDALAVALDRLAERAVELGAEVHMPRIGTGLGGGDWRRIEALVREHLAEKGVAVTVYDLPPRHGSRSHGSR